MIGWGRHVIGWGFACDRMRLSCDRMGLSCDKMGLSCDRMGEHVCDKMGDMYVTGWGFHVIFPAFCTALKIGTNRSVS